MAAQFINHQSKSRRQELKFIVERVESAVHSTAQFMHVASGVLTGGATWLYLSGQHTSTASALAISAVIGGMTIGALAMFTSAAIKILPRLSGRFQLGGAVFGIAALGAVLIVSGTSNATFLAHNEALSLHIERSIAQADGAFGTAQDSLRKLGQMQPILETGAATAKSLKEYEVDDGTTGAGKGPIYQELLVQETRLTGAGTSIENVIENGENQIRLGQKTLVSIRRALEDGKLSRTERGRVLENGLTRLSSIVIELRQQMPLSSLDGTAQMMRSPISLSTYSTIPDVRRAQEETITRLHREFEPIGLSLTQAVSELAERLPEDVPPYRHMSPTSVVFAYADELFWILAVGYALDILPYMAIGLILLAHRQIDIQELSSLPDDIFPRPSHEGRRRNRLGNGSRYKGKMNGSNLYRSDFRGDDDVG